MAIDQSKKDYHAVVFFITRIIILPNDLLSEIFSHLIDFKINLL